MSAPPPLDIVTALQESLGRLNAMLFNYVGALQRDAPPQLLKQQHELLVAPAKSYDVQANVELMSSDMIAGLKDIEQLIQQLPQLSSNEADEVAQAVSLFQQNAEAAQEMRQALDAAVAKLEQLQDAHGALAETVLAAGVAPPDPPAHSTPAG